MATVRSNIPEIAQKWLQGVETQVEAAVTRALTKTSIVGEARVKGIMEKEAYDTGRLLRSVTSQIKKTGPDLIKLIIGSNLQYALYVEEGRKPGKWPNLNALVKWVGRRLRRQGINARVNLTFEQLKGMARSGRRGHPTEAQRVARQQLPMLYLVGRKIATRGIRQKLLFRRVEAGLLAFFRAETTKELESVARSN